MARDDYYVEAISYAAEEAGVILTAEQAEQMAASLVVSIENHSIATGAHCIPNPMAAEIAELKRQHARELLDRDKRERVLVEKVAARYRVHPDRIGVHDGRILHYDGRTEELT